MPDQKLLSVENLSIEAGDTTIIEAVDLEIKPGEMVGLVGESSALVATKTKQALDAGLSVMVCVGETLEEREAGRIDAVVLDDHMAALKGKFSEAEWARIAIAYEPVWAIGTGKTLCGNQISGAPRFRSCFCAMA